MASKSLSVSAFATTVKGSQSDATKLRAPPASSDSRSKASPLAVATSPPHLSCRSQRPLLEVR